MAITGSGYIKRSEFMLFANVSATATPEWEIIGDKVEELNLAMNPNVKTTTDILGLTGTTLDKYEVQTDVAPMKAKRNSKLAAILYDIVKNEKTLSDVEHEFLAVNVFDASEGNYAAWKQSAVVAVQSYGGNTEGLDIPFNLHWIGTKTHGVFNPATQAFTPSTGAQYLVTFSLTGTESARLAGAQIVINGQLLTADENGIAEILLPAGTYEYTASISGYDPITDSIIVSTAAVYEAVTMTAS